MFNRTVGRLTIGVVTLGLLAACAGGDTGGAAPTAAPAGGGAAAPAATKAPAAPKGPTVAPTAPPPTSVPTPLPTIPSIGQVLQGLTPEGYHYLGRADAPVTMVQAGDFLCRACARYVLETEPQIIQNYVASGKLKIVYRQAANLGDLSVRMSEAAECVGEIGRFWEMRYGLYQRQQVLFSAAELDTALGKLGQEVGADQTKYNLCMEEREHLAEILTQANEARQTGERELPVFEINGTKLGGAKSYAELAQAIDTALPK